MFILISWLFLMYCSLIVNTSGITVTEKVSVNLEQIQNADPIPIVLWHGVNDSCCNSFMDSIANFLKENIPGVYVKSLKIGKTEKDDIRNSFFMNVNDQVTNACQQISSDVVLANGYNAIGISQGAQFLRGVLQRCSKPKVKNYISLGGQHQGIFGIPDCKSIFCKYLYQIVSYGAYTKLVQNHIVQAEYWHDPLNEKQYKINSVFLADINNELEINETYKKNILNLENFVLVMFANDSLIIPRESEWFGFFKPGQAEEIYTLKQSSLYKGDRLGLQKLDLLGKLHLLSLHGDHVQIDWEWFHKNIIERFLLN